MSKAVIIDSFDRLCKQHYQGGIGNCGIAVFSELGRCGVLAFYGYLKSSFESSTISEPFPVSICFGNRWKRALTALRFSNPFMNVSLFISLHANGCGYFVKIENNLT